jgi:carboxylesterase
MLIIDRTPDKAGCPHMSDAPLDQVKPGCEPFAAQGSGDNARIGVVLVHGFTGSPDSTAPWAKYLNERGYTVNAIRLPGHGTTWQDANTKSHSDLQHAVDDAFEDMRARTDKTYLMGVSYGCALSLRVAADRPDDVAGLVLVNPWIRKDAIVAWQRYLVPFQRFLPYITKSVPGVASDIADPNSAELGYERVPVLLVVDMIKTFDELHPLLDRVTAPILLVRSVNDHIQGPKNGEMIRERTRSTIEDLELDRSYHVATIDYDAERIFANSVDFIEAHA